jgi:hypothetical protein
MNHDKQRISLTNPQTPVSCTLYFFLSWWMVIN